MSEFDAVLFANEAFYLAFSTGDLEAMETVWAEDAPLTCVHPGWDVLSGRDEVMGSWEAILSNPESPAVTCINPEAHVRENVGYVVCYESLDAGFLIATNVFIREGGTWKMIHHQAGAAPPPDDDDDGNSEPNTIQ